jgi:glyoxylase-like metal-dependent hydrolase (beta-lactamase superfamily II)
LIVSDSFKHEDVTGVRFGYSPFGKPNMFVHIYYIDGLLIDTGQRRALKYILKATQGLEVDQMFITHHHEDHTGNIDQLSAEHRCPVFASEQTCIIMRNPPKLSLAQKLLYGVRGANHKLQPIGGILETEQYKFEIVPIPGHASDMVALYERSKAWLFSADLFVNTYIAYFLEDEDIALQIESTKRILELDFEVLFCAHKPQIKGGRQKLEKKLNFLESFYEDVSSLYAKGHSENEIFRQLKLQESHFVKFLSGGHLSKMNMLRSVIRSLNN